MKKIILASLISALSLSSAFFYKEITAYFTPAVEQSVVDTTTKSAEDTLLNLEKDAIEKAKQELLNNL